MRFFYLFFWLLVGLYSSFAQITINGLVQNEKDEPIQDCHIHCKKAIATTTAEGLFSLEVKPGKNKIGFHAEGCLSYDTIIYVYSTTFLKIKLKTENNLLKEVTVTQNNKKNKTSIEQSLTQTALLRHSNQTLAFALKDISGVSVLQNGSSLAKPIINGLYGNRVPIFTEGVKLEDQQWGREHAPNLSVNLASKITVVKGAQALQYGGDAIGGMIFIEQYALKKDTLFGKINTFLDSNGRGGGFASSIHKSSLSGWSYNLYQSTKYMGDRMAPNYVLSNTGNREITAAGDVSYQKDKIEFKANYSFYHTTIGILSASHIGNANNLLEAIETQTPFIVNDFTYNIQNPKQRITHHFAKLNFIKKWNEQQSLQLFYAFQLNKRFEFDVRRGDANERPALDLTLFTHNFQSDYKIRWKNKEFKTGVNFSFQDNFSNPQTGVRPLIPSFEKIDFGAYSIFQTSSSLWGIFEAGLRYDFTRISATKFYQKSRWQERDYNEGFSQFIIGDFGTQWLTKPEFQFQNIAISTSYQKGFEHNWEGILNFNIANRNPNVSELFSDGLHHAIAQIELGDLRLNKETSYKTRLQVIKKWNVFTVEASPFFNVISNFIYLTPKGAETTNRGTFLVWDYVQNKASITGIDVKSQLFLSNNWKHETTLSYVRGTNLDVNLPLIDMPPLQIRQKLVFKKPEWKNLLIEFQNELVFSQKRFPLTNVTLNIIENNELTPALVDISTPPPFYNLFHFYGEVAFPFFKKYPSKIAFSVQNLLNTPFRDYLNRQRFFADDLGRNIQLQLIINI